LTQYHSIHVERDRQTDEIAISVSQVPVCIHEKYRRTIKMYQIKFLLGLYPHTIRAPPDPLAGFKSLAFFIIIINDIYRAQTSPRSKCAKSAVAQ